MAFLKYTVTVTSATQLHVKMTYDTYGTDYSVSIGYLGKHGMQGYCSRDFLCFEGGKVLQQPKECFLNPKVKIDLLCVEIIFEGQTYCDTWKHLDWFGLYDIRKRCFSVGKLQTIPLGETLKLHMPEGLFASGGGTVFEKISGLYQYYEAIFGPLQQSVYDIYLFNYTEDRKIFAGAGQTSQGATFDPGRIRDWELMSHRMFHAFFDSNLKKREMLLPPYLWLYEGLAVYHELEAVKSLGFGDGWPLLEKRYAYAREKYKEKLDLDPLQERQYIPDGYKIEFLHYTQAPLLVRKNGGMDLTRGLLTGQDAGRLLEKMQLELPVMPFFGPIDRDLQYFDYILESWGI